jgi:tight adherence protein C
MLAVLCVACTFFAVTSGVERYLKWRRVAIKKHNRLFDRLARFDAVALLEEKLMELGEVTHTPLVRKASHAVHRSRKRREREQIIRELPHMIDVITLSVAAGLPFDAALASYTDASDTVLSAQFKLALQYWQTGLKLRAEALDDVVTELECTEVARFVSALKQSLVLGTALVYVLEAQGAEARDAHKQYIETRIAKTPVKMLLPMATCVIPSLLLLLLGPVVIDVMRGLGSGI